ncbi:helix-turn-helix domain-containing protein [Streptomyces sp. SID13666]|uniref:helix-turn-helix domain-containing protein n=1 Tax=unclassified Streptomyces TaxID=2593676 RepID=UPI0013BF3CD2|nr:MULTISPECIES: helix-turn-helix transcriptional regulator [unclassified Streptomyces]NEA60373.1 helix-turn-helix domain-containing protein [Streptomyces sp. SID13666]NEA76765.1 helix-turn-helix domain-containing protein [Streptomyces sp. SID13588]
MSDELFSSVDALLAAVNVGTVLPPPAERQRLRRAAGLTTAHIAAALRVDPALVQGWEDGAAVPGPEIAPAYARLLEGLAERFPAPAAGQPAPTPQPLWSAPAAAAAGAEVADRGADGEVLMLDPMPCRWCGMPTPIRVGGVPQHLGGFCRTRQPPAAPAPVTVAPVQPAPAPVAPPAPAPVAAPAAPVVVEPVRPVATAPWTPAAGARRHPAAARTPSRPAAARPAGPTDATAAAARWWPVVALDVAPDGGWLLDVPQVPAPAGAKLADWFAWLGTGLPLRVERAHASGRGGDGMVCLTEAALKQLGLPAALPTTDKALTALQAKLAKAAGTVGMEVSDQIGPAFHAFRRKGSAGGPRTSVRITVAPWLGQGDARQQATSALAAPLATAPDGTVDGLTLARRFRAFTADLGVAPGATTASTAMLLLDAVRPRVEWVKDQATGEWSSHLRDGALPAGDLSVASAAGARHPLTRELLDRGEAVCEEEDYKWWARTPTPEEAGRPFAVAVDVCASYLSVTESLRLPSGPLEYTADPVWDGGKTAGLWWCDFTTTAVDDLLPHPATFHGLPPTGPGWYATPTVAYMATTYGFDPATITDAQLSTHTVPLLKEWTGRLRGGYKRAYADLGLSDGQSPTEFLAAYAVHKDVGQDPVRADALVLAGLYKNIYKGGIGKWADSARHLDDAAWLEKVAASWAYRPEIRFHIIAAARIAAHRRLRKTWQLTGRAPFAVNVDSYLYATDAPSPLELLPVKDDGSPIPGALRLGIAPGSHKHESSFPLAEAVAAMELREHPSRLVHQYGTDGSPVDHAKDDAREGGGL